jgi:hypothetical protein
MGVSYGCVTCIGILVTLDDFVKTVHEEVAWLIRVLGDMVASFGQES